MWQRFTERARKVVFFAQEEAGELGQNIVASEHLLLGLLRESDSVAVRVLIKLGVSPKEIKAEVAHTAIRGEGRADRDMQLAPAAKRVIDLAYDEARILSNNYIGTEHLLVGLLRQEGTAAQALVSAGADLERVRAEIRSMQGISQTIEPAAPSSVGPSSQNLFLEVARLSERARARAEELGKSEIAFEHIVLAAADDPNSMIARALLLRGTTADDLRNAILEVYASDAPP